MTINTHQPNGVHLEAALNALDALSQERQAQYERLQFAAQAKQQLESTLHAHCQIASAKERFGLR